MIKVFNCHYFFFFILWKTTKLGCILWETDRYIKKLGGREHKEKENGVDKKKKKE